MPDVMKTVGRYEILRELGRGGMALVYLARQTDLDRFVALKELGAFHASDPSFAQRFIRESRMAGSLSHPNIVTVHDYFEHDGTPYIAMEYVERGSLRPYINTMTLNQMGGVLEGLLAGLAAAEQHGIVHRDLKPENLMVTSDGRIKIADFGIAKATTRMQTGAFLTATGTTVGTPTYMAPEQAMAQDIGPWTDLYSVGCMAYELFTGKVPFHDSDAPMAILLRHVNEQIAPAASVADVDQDISDWIERLLVKDPTKRTQSANQAWDEFEEIIIGSLGPRWRREARLLEPGETRGARGPSGPTPVPLTPAPFEGAPDGAPPSDEFQSFAWGQPGAAGTATPPPVDVVEEAPPPPAVTTPPPTEVPKEDTGFLTFGSSAPAAEPTAPPPEVTTPPPVEAAPPTQAAGPSPPAPAAPAGAAPAAPVEGPPAEDEGFETYIAPSPPRPPTATPDEPSAAMPPTSAPPAPVTPPPTPPTPPTPPAPPRTPAPAASAPPAPKPPTPTPPAPAAATQASPPSPADMGATVMPDALKKPPAGPAPTKAPPRPAKPKEPAKPREPGRERSVVPFVVAGVLVAAIIGFLIGGSGGGGDGEQASGAPNAAASNDQIELLFPSDWANTPPPEIPGLTFDRPVSLSSGGTAGGPGVVAGVIPADANNASLLSRGLIGAIGNEAPAERQAVELSREQVQALRYDGLQPKDFDGRVTVFAAPTSLGVATVACYAPAAVAAGFTAQCEAIANTLKLNDGTAFPVGPSKEYAEKLSSTLATLDKAVKSGRADLRGAKTPGSQANAADKIAKAYAAAAAELKGVELGPADGSANALLVSALGKADVAYRKMGNAADRNSKTAFDDAKKDVAAAEEELTNAFAGLKAAGYDTG